MLQSSSSQQHQQHGLGTAPSPEAIDEWLRLEMGLEKTVIGRSLQGRDLIIYSLELVLSHDDSTITTTTISKSIEALNVPTVLFLSLVHGNEPMGLLALLSTVEELKTLFGSGAAERTRLRGSPSLLSSAVRIIFFPIVNIDAYTANIAVGEGCRRSNLRHTCEGMLAEEPECPLLSRDGVDLNRNFRMDWNGTYAKDGISRQCSSGARGLHPFSEPESQAIRDVVWNWNVSAAMSFHSRSTVGRPDLLIHPYASLRPLEGNMQPSHIHRYRTWRRAMDPSKFYISGTAQEAIGYTASGCTIDWLQSPNITAFVVEVTPPCGSRWCQEGPSSIHGESARRFVQLVAGAEPMSIIDIPSTASSPEPISMIHIPSTVRSPERISMIDIRSTVKSPETFPIIILWLVVALVGFLWWKWRYGCLALGSRPVLFGSTSQIGEAEAADQSSIEKHV